MCQNIIEYLPWVHGHGGRKENSVWRRYSLSIRDCPHHLYHVSTVGIPNQPLVQESGEVIPSDNCRRCIWKEILDKENIKDVLASYAKLVWRLTDQRKLRGAHEVRERKAALQALMYLDAESNERILDQSLENVEALREAAVVYWRRTWNQQQYSEELSGNLRDAQEACFNFRHPKVQAWIVEEPPSTYRRMRQNSLLLREYFPEMRTRNLQLVRPFFDEDDHAAAGGTPAEQDSIFDDSEEGEIAPEQPD